MSASFIPSRSTSCKIFFLSAPNAKNSYLHPGKHFQLFQQLLKECGLRCCLSIPRVRQGESGGQKILGIEPRVRVDCIVGCLDEECRARQQERPEQLLPPPA